MYIVYHGQTYIEGCLKAIYYKKKDAIKDIRKLGYKKDTESELYYKGLSFFRIEKINYVNKLNY